MNNAFIASKSGGIQGCEIVKDTNTYWMCKYFDSKAPFKILKDDTRRSVFAHMHDAIEFTGDKPLAEYHRFIHEQCMMVDEIIQLGQDSMTATILADKLKAEFHRLNTMEGKGWLDAVAVVLASQGGVTNMVKEMLRAHDIRHASAESLAVFKKYGLLSDQ